MISIVIRTKNERYWLERVLKAIRLQGVKNLETIVVDNNSKDGTASIASKYDCKLIRFSNKKFNYSKALNMGIAQSKGGLVAILSGHAIPVNDRWLEGFIANFSSKKVAACYGKQEPLPDSNIFDKRDLWTTFGPEKKIQTKDYFFHNANSMIRKSIWKKIPFDESLNGVEDRDWARKVLKKGYSIIYEPSASVYHHHGIHQAGDRERCKRVVKIIETIRSKKI
ncbi:MAG: glycosyltransferase [Candidatus Omnitrophica bacterium]|nr:glycosyltransferase [Candidatus Omnitrophota bacterium]